MDMQTNRMEKSFCGWRPLACKLLLGLCMLVTPCRVMADEPQLAKVDSLLKVFDESSRQQRFALATQLIECCRIDDPLSDEQQLSIDKSMPQDSIDLKVWFAAERYYYLHSYFNEAIALIDRALPLTLHGQVDMRTTLLCDRGYCQYKTGRSTEAVDTEMEAERLARTYGLLQSQARAYNYLAIINVSLGFIDEAKHFVKKAIETDQKSGDHANTHNYLGIACEIYSVANIPDSAIYYGRQAVEAAREIGYDEGVVNHLSQLSYAYNRKGEYAEALKLAKEAVATVKRMPVVDRNLLAISLEYVAYTLLDMKRNAEAVPVIREAIALQQEVGNTRSVCYDYKSLAEALEPNEPREALVALRHYSKMMDSIHNAQMHDALSQANAQLHNNELTEVNASTKRENQRIILTSVFIILLLAAAVASLYYSMRQRGRTNRMLKQLQKVREQFFTNVTHEFRTPLTIILGLSRQMQEDHPASSPKQAGRLIEQQGRRLLELVNQLLDMTKLQAASMVKPSTVCQNVVGQIETIVEGFRGLAQQKDVTLTYEPAERQVVIDYVPDYLNKVLTNLLSNAVKFTNAGGSVVVRTQVVNDKFLLSVSDTGCGIPKNQLGYIFDPFYQVETDKSKNSGTGIGLSLVRQLVNAVDGTLNVESEVGRGSTFTVSIHYKPCRKAEEKQDVASVPTKPSVAPTAEPTAPELNDADVANDTRTRILIVDDNSSVAYYIGTVLSKRYDVFYAADGQSGLDKARQIMPDLVVTDVMMPVMDGLELCRKIRTDEMTSHIPVVVITAKSGDNDRLEGLKAGADAYLTKPFNEQELLILVAQLLEQRRALREKFSQQYVQMRAADTEELTEQQTPLDRQFLNKVDALIVELMAQGQADLEHVAAHLYIHPPTFRRKVTAITGIPPAQYIMRRRIEEACNLLADYPKITIAEVAERCGFSDSAHFVHVFRRFKGTTPLKWAKQKNEK